jgi:hypothetical protein
MVVCRICVVVVWRICGSSNMEDLCGGNMEDRW